MPHILKFPEGFLWGSATSAHQIEGNTRNDWSEWEKSDQRIADLKRRGEDPLNFISGAAADSWNRFEEDVRLLKELNQKVYRLSIEWSRVEPEEGVIDQEVIQRYKYFVKTLCDAGIEPIVTLWHFTNPLWLARRGGWLHSSAPDAFIRFIHPVVDNLKPYVKTWITFNEATTVYTGLSYLRGIWPPQEKSMWKVLRVTGNIVKAHRRAYKEIKKIYQDSPNEDQRGAGGSEYPSKESQSPMSHNVKVGIVENLTYIVHGPRWYQRVLGRMYSYWRNHYGLSSMAPYSDFIGLNYYHVDRRFGGTHGVLPAGLQVPDPYWELHAEGMYRCLKDLTRYKKPILVTENGLPDAEDRYRAQFIKDHLHSVWRAIQDGVDVRGYLHWSLLDNFEWASGYGPRFGLVAVDFKTFSRTIRPSAREYATICKENQLVL